MPPSLQYFIKTNLIENRNPITRKYFSEIWFRSKLRNNFLSRRGRLEEDFVEPSALMDECSGDDAIKLLPTFTLTILAHGKHEKINFAPFRFERTIA